MNASLRVDLTFSVTQHKRADAAPLLNVQHTFPAKGITVVYGESGSGKTTLLRCIAGLEKRAEGQCQLGDRVWQNADVILPTHKRRVGYVFQQDGLLPHLTVMGNLEYARKRGADPSLNLLPLLQLLGIETLMSRSVESLSGGERQRVSIARALASQPDVLLMDEPLAALDSRRKAEILPYLTALKSSLSIPIIYVTHSEQELAKLADEVIEMHAGQKRFSGSPHEFLAQRALDVSAKRRTILTGDMSEYDEQWKLAKFVFDDQALWVRHPNPLTPEPTRIQISATDVSVTLSQPNHSSILNILPAIVEHLTYFEEQGVCSCALRIGRSVVYADITAKSAHELGLKKGQAVWAQIKAVAII